VAGAVLCAGCSSPGTLSATTTSPPRPPASSSTSSTTSSTTAGLAHCEASGLAGSVVGTQGAAGTIEVTVALENTTTAPCALEGYPGLELVSPSGAALPTTTVRGGSYSFTDFSAVPVTVAPGASAYFNLGYSDVPAGSGPCPDAASVWVTPPDDVEHLVLDTSITACNGTVTVSPVFASGSSQTRTTAP
jgi:hypothetical protein